MYRKSGHAENDDKYVKRGDFHIFSKANLETGLKGNSVDMPHRKWDQVSNLVLFGKNGKNEQIFPLKSFYTLCIEDRVLTLNLHVAHANAFHVKKKPFIFIESDLVQF